MHKAGFVILIILSLTVAAYALGIYSFLPLGAALDPHMRANFAVHQPAIYTHIFAAVCALVVGPFQFAAHLRNKYPMAHRWAGRVYLAIGVFVGGLAGLYMAFHASGGYVARLGFACLAVLWLLTGYHAWRAIRKGDFNLHRRWMQRNFSLTFAAVTLRLWLPAAVMMDIPFTLAYPTIAWLSWVPNLLFVEVFLIRADKSAMRISVARQARP